MELSASPSSTRWNIFARELENVLSARNLRLGHLDDRGIVQHPEKVRRLQHSLEAPSRFPVLNPDEIERLVDTLRLSAEEQCRIRAALLATAVERVLMDRLQPAAALMAANDVYEICLAVMREDPTRTMSAAVRAGVSRGDGRGDGDTDEALFAEALDLIDAGTLALHGASDALTPQAKRAHARSAELSFGRALTLLQGISAPLEQRSDYEAYVREAHEGQSLVRTML